MKKLLLFFYFVCASIPLNAMTLSEMRSEVRFRIHDTTSTVNVFNLRYSDSFLNTRINQVMKEISQTAYPIYSKQLISAVTAQQEYAVSTDTIKIDKVVFLISSSTSSYRRLTYETPNSLDTDVSPTWEQNPPALPLYWYQINNKIGIVPAPSGTYSVANAIKIYYYKQPQIMLSDTDSPFDGVYSLESYHYLIVLGTVIKCKQDIGLDASGEKQIYDIGVARMAADMGAPPPRQGVINVTH